VALILKKLIAKVSQPRHLLETVYKIGGGGSEAGNDK